MDNGENGNLFIMYYCVWCGADYSAPHCQIKRGRSDQNGNINRSLGGFRMFHTALCKSGTSDLSISYTIGVQGDFVGNLQ